jgi:hypothetical protein
MRRVMSVADGVFCLCVVILELFVWANAMVDEVVVTCECDTIMSGGLGLGGGEMRLLVTRRVSHE